MKQKKLKEKNPWFKEIFNIKKDRYRNKFTFGTKQQFLNRYLNISDVSIGLLRKKKLCFTNSGFQAGNLEPMRAISNDISIGVSSLKYKWRALNAGELP